MIAIAAPHIAMAPGSTIGAAEPRPLDPKTVSFMRDEFAATAQRHNRDANIAAAMVDADIVIDGLVGPGKLLTLTAQDALKVGYADLLTNYRSDILATMRLIISLWWKLSATGLSGWRCRTEPTVSQILLILGWGLSLSCCRQIRAARCDWRLSHGPVLGGRIQLGWRYE